MPSKKTPAEPTTRSQKRAPAKRPREAATPSTRAAAAPTDPKRVVATIAMQADGDIAWIDYTDGPYLTSAPIDFSQGDEIAFDDPAGKLTALVNVTTFAFLAARRDDGSIRYCAVRTPRWW